MAITGIRGDEGCDIDGRRIEVGYLVGRTPSSCQYPTTIVNIEDTSLLHGNNDITGVDRKVKEADNRGNILEPKLVCHDVLCDIRFPGDLMQEAICASHCCMT